MKTPSQIAFDISSSIAEFSIPVAVPVGSDNNAASLPAGRAVGAGVVSRARPIAADASVAAVVGVAPAEGADGSASNDGCDVGDTVLTPYGLGRIEAYREIDGMHVVKMDGFGGTLFVKDVALIEKAKKKEEEKKSIVGDAVSTPYGLGRIEEYREIDGMHVVTMDGFGGTLFIREVSPIEEAAGKKKKKTSMELNAAYEALETMRRLNLEMECHEAGVVFNGANDPATMCKSCLLEGHAGRNRFSRLQKLVDDRGTDSTRKLGRMWARGTGEEEKKNPLVLPRIQKLMEQKERKAASPCLICAHRCCSRHCSASFRKEGITLCSECELFFELDFIVECVSNADPTARRRSVDHMIDLYDRCLLLLKYSSQFADGIAESLEARTQRTDKIGLGSSGAGVVSGALGVAAAASILTPAGPPLLIASLVFGGSATAVQTGAEARGYFSEPRRLADRIIALHGMAHSVLRVAGTLRDACCMDHIRTEAYVLADGKLSAEHLKKSLEKNQTAIKAGAKVTTGAALSGAIAAETAAVAGAEAGVIGARTSAALTRAGTATARAMRFARFAGGALSAAVLVLEAKNIDSTLKSIKAGSPCEKAETLRGIKEELEELPQTERLDNECQAYLLVLDQQHALTPHTRAIRPKVDV